MTTRMKLAALAVAPLFVKRAIMARRFDREISETGEAELPYLGEFLSEGRSALDVGSNLGTYSYAMARHGAQVIALEPNPAMFRTLASLKFRNVAVRNVAASDTSGTGVLHLPPGQRHVLATIEETCAAADSARVPVDLVRIDDLDLPALAFIKVDVEGAEERVIAGALETLARDRPSLLIEIEERHNPGGLSRLAATLAKLGYEPFFLRDGKWQPLMLFDGAVDQNESAFSTPAKTRRAIPYINNFLFRAPKHQLASAANR